MRRIYVFCSANSETQDIYLEAARQMGLILARRGIGLVYAGGKMGMMGAIADTALEAGGEVIGVMPHCMVKEEMAHQGLSELRVIQSQGERKTVIANLADAFIALPGDYGALEEFFEALTWTQLRLPWKPCGLLNVAGYYNHLLAFLDHDDSKKVINAGIHSIVLAEQEVEKLLDQVVQYRTRIIQREGWKDRGPQLCV